MRIMSTANNIEGASNFSNVERTSNYVEQEKLVHEHSDAQPQVIRIYSRLLVTGNIQLPDFYKSNN